MNREETKKCIKVMQHFVDYGEIECGEEIFHNPEWDWMDRPSRYTIPKPNPIKIKLLAFLTPQGSILLCKENSPRHRNCIHYQYTRIPSKDEWVEVESE